MLSIDKIQVNEKLNLYLTAALPYNRLLMLPALALSAQPPLCRIQNRQAYTNAPTEPRQRGESAFAEQAPTSKFWVFYLEYEL